MCIRWGPIMGQHPNSIGYLCAHRKLPFAACPRACLSHPRPACLFFYHSTNHHVSLSTAMPSRRKSRKPKVSDMSSCKGHILTRHQMSQGTSLDLLPDVVEGTRSIDVLLFPSDVSSPQIVHVDCRIEGDEEYPSEESHSIDWKSLLGQDAAFSCLPIGQVEMRPGMLLTPSRLYLAFNDCFAIDGSPLNLCAYQLTGGRGHTDWGGNLVGYRAREPADSLTQFMDVSMNDLAAFVRFLEDHGAPVARERGPTTEREEDSEELASATTEASGNAEALQEEKSMRMPGPPPPEYPRASGQTGTTTGRNSEAPLIHQDLSGRLRRPTPILTREDVRRMIWEELFNIAWSLGCGYMTWRFLFPAIDALYRVWGVKNFLSLLWLVVKGLIFATFVLPVLLALICVPLVLFAFIVLGCAVAGLAA